MLERKHEHFNAFRSIKINEGEVIVNSCTPFVRVIPFRLSEMLGNVNSF